MPVWNEVAHVEQAVDSVRRQTWPHWHLWIYDDGSTDGTTELVQALARGDSRITLIEGDRNRGVVTALNRLLEATEADVVARLDADDVAHENRLAAQMRHYRDDALVVGGYELLYPSGRTTGPHVPPTRGLERHLAYTNPIVHSTVLGSRTLLTRYGYREVPLAEDYDMYCRMALGAVPFVVCPQPVLRYRVRWGKVADEERAFDQNVSALWLGAQMRRRRPHLGLDGLARFRRRYSIGAFARSWPLYVESLVREEGVGCARPGRMLRYLRYDSLTRAIVSNSMRYANVQRFWRLRDTLTDRLRRSAHRPAEAGGRP